MLIGMEVLRASAIVHHRPVADSCPIVPAIIGFMHIQTTDIEGFGVVGIYGYIEGVPGNGCKINTGCKIIREGLFCPRISFISRAQNMKTIKVVEIVFRICKTRTDEGINDVWIGWSRRQYDPTRNVVIKIIFNFRSIGIIDNPRVLGTIIRIEYRGATCTCCIGPCTDKYSSVSSDGNIRNGIGYGTSAYIGQNLLPGIPIIR